MTTSVTKEPSIDYVSVSNLFFGWKWPSVGFGQLAVEMDSKGDHHIMNEYMDRESVRKILHAYADYIADHAILSDTNDI